MDSHRQGSGYLTGGDYKGRSAKSRTMVPVPTLTIKGKQMTSVLQDRCYKIVVGCYEESLDDFGLVIRDEKLSPRESDD